MQPGEEKYEWVSDFVKTNDITHVAHKSNQQHSDILVDKQTSLMFQNTKHYVDTVL